MLPAQGTACAKAPGLLFGGGWGEPLRDHQSVFSSRSCGLSDQLVWVLCLLDPGLSLGSILGFLFCFLSWC